MRGNTRNQGALSCLLGAKSSASALMLILLSGIHAWLNNEFRYCL